MDWQKQRSMDAHEFAVTMKKLKMTKAGMARYLDCSSSTVRRYSRGVKEIPVPEVLLLRALLHFQARPLVPDWTEEWEKRQ